RCHRRGRSNQIEVSKTVSEREVFMGKIGLIILGIVVVLAVAIGGWAIGGYNTLVGKRNEVDKAWSQVENNLTRRADLIGNLVGTVKGIAGQEKEVFGRIA